MKLSSLRTPWYSGVQLPPSKRGLPGKMLLIMRLTTIFLLATALQISAKGISQKISISGKNMPLEKVFASIEGQSNYPFLYKYNDLLKASPPLLLCKNHIT